jgi:hypothetical protein
MLLSLALLNHFHRIFHQGAVKNKIGTLDSYQLNLVQKTQEIFYSPRKGSGRKGFRSMNGNSTFSAFAFPI